MKTVIYEIANMLAAFAAVVMIFTARKALDAE
jgi:hypothetical protein